MKALPKLSKAQQEAWARVLEWYAQDKRDDYFISGGTREYAKIDSYIIPGTKTIFRALVSKGLLVIVDHRRKMFVDRYTIHPDYLPDSEPAAAPESEPAKIDAPRFKVGDKVTPNYGMWKNAVCTVDEKYRDQGGVTRYVLKDAAGQIGIIRYKADELEPAASEPATDDRPTSDEARLIDSITEARMERQRLENENASLASQLEALRVRFTEMEAENAALSRQLGDVLSVVKELEAELKEEAADLEATALREMQIAARVTELEAENAKLRAALFNIQDIASGMWDIGRVSFTEDSDYGEYAKIARIAKTATES